MKINIVKKAFGISLLIAIVVAYHLLFPDGSATTEHGVASSPTLEGQEHRAGFKNSVVVVVVACGNRLHETLTMLKSAIMFTRAALRFIVVAEDALMQSFREKLAEWQERSHHTFKFAVLPLTFPADDGEEWRQLFKPCAAQRLFLPSVLRDVDSALYVDTDVLFLAPVEAVWDHFRRMNGSQMAALAPEHEDPNIGWYNRFARHPYYGKMGVNSGVMLMNLTRMRSFQWTRYVRPIYQRYRLQITWGDQDIINIIFHYHPDKLYVYSCRYNFRPDHCMYTSVCKQAENEGVVVIHGSRGFFHSRKQPAFEAIYRAFEEVGGSLWSNFYQPLESYLASSSNTNCDHIKSSYLKGLRKYIKMEEG